MEDGSSRVVSETLQRVPTRTAGVLFEGPAGIGKTHRWTQAVTSATVQGWRVLVARPGEAEARLGGTGLIDLLADVTDDELATLPIPQRQALRAALLRDEAVPDADPRIVSVALTSLLRELARRTPVVIAIDDLQWLDAHTMSLLGAHLGRAYRKLGVRSRAELVARYAAGHFQA